MANVQQILIPQRAGPVTAGAKLVSTQATTLGAKLGAQTAEQRFHYRDYPDIRDAFICTNSDWYRKGRVISMFCNPLSVNFTIPRRETVVKTAAGVVRNTWRNRYRNTYLDEFMVNITFQTGNIMPSAGSRGADYGTGQEKTQVGVPPGLLNFYEFMELIDEPALQGPFENRHIIILFSRAFPVLRMEGYFTQSPIGLQLSAEDQNSFTWNAEFQVYYTSPRITSKHLLESTYITWASTVALEEALPPRPNQVPPPPPPVARGQKPIITAPSSSSTTVTTPYQKLFSA